VQELATQDPDYPAPLAQAILELRLQRPREAIQILAPYVEREPNGRFALRARNTLRAAQEQLLRFFNP
jgi:hypothetical protein